MKLSRRVQELEVSPTLQVKMEADRMRAEGIDIVDFGPGEPDFDTPSFIRDAAKRALDEGDTHYGGAAGKPALREAVARAASRPGGAWSAAEVLLGLGGKGALFLLMQALVDPGDEVIVFSPYWVSFPDQVRLAGGSPVIVETREAQGFLPDPAAAAARIGERCKGIILNTPCNPTGAVIPPETLEAFADLARQRDLWMVCDETYDRFVYAGSRFNSALGLRERSGDRVVVVNSFSKTFAMTGWRIGYALAPRPVIAAMTGIQSHDATHPTSFVQTAALAATEGDRGTVASMLEEYALRRDLVLEGLASVPGVTCPVPGGAFYVFPAVRELCRSVGSPSSADLAARLLREAHIAVVAGEAFGCEGHVRLSYALSRPAIAEGIERLRRFAVDAGR